MSKWDTLKSRFQERNRDLDAEFEQFLNESLSEDSFTSPRNKSHNLKSGKSLGGIRSSTPGEGTSAKQWWESSVEDDSSKDNLAPTWFKTTTTVKEEENEDETEIEEKKEEEKIKEKEVMDEVITTKDDNLEVPEATGVSVTMSKDSLDDGPRETLHENEPKLQSVVDKDRHDSIEEDLDGKDEEDYSYTEPSGTPTNSASSPHETPQGTGRNVVTENVESTETDINTAKELEEKQEFFEKLEQENKSNLDYRKLNEILDEDTSVTDRGRTGDFLQATGAELGNSIFNTTGLGEREVTSQVEKDNDVLNKKSQMKPSMLSKVSLMDSLESSMGTAQRQKIKQIRKKQIDVPEEGSAVAPSFHDAIQEEYSINVESDDDHETVKVLDEGTGTGLLNTSAANELADLHRALKDAQMVSTHDSGRMVLQEDLQNTIKTVDTIAPEKLVVPDPHEDRQPRGISDEITQLRPVIAIATDDDSKGFSYSPSVSVPHLNHTVHLPSEGMALEQQGIILPRHSDQQHDKPVLGNLDIFQTCQTGFPSNAGQGFELPEKQQYDTDRGLVLQPTSSRAAVANATTRHGVSVPEGDHNFGFSLQPVKNIVETVSSDEDTPPADSLKGIKSIVKKRRATQNRGSGFDKETKRDSPKLTTKSKAVKKGEKRSPDVKTKPGKQKTKKETGGVKKGDVMDDRTRYGWMGNSRTTTPSRAAKGGQTAKDRKEKQYKTPQKSHKVLQSSPAHLMASVETFANYLNTFIHDDDPAKATRHGDWLAEHPDDRSLAESLAGKRLSREHALRKEVEHWQCMWQDERKQNEKLVDELVEKDKEWKRREKTLNLESKKEMNDLRQQVFVLESKLRDVNAETDPKKKVAKGGSLKGMSDEELRKLEKEIRDQEQLLSGYQRENEQLCQVLKDAQTKSKEIEKQMFQENQKLASEVAVLKEKLERKQGVFGMDGAATMGAERIHQLRTQVQVLKTNEQEMRSEIDNLENERTKLQKEVKTLEREKDVAIHKAQDAQGTNSQALRDMESTHAGDVERLNRKLKWYIENQELLDKDSASLREKNKEIKELRELVERLEKERGQTTIEKDKKEKERAVDAKRIQDLERQIREMEQIIKRRYPNSIPALIYAASATPGLGKPVQTDDSPKKSSALSYAFLESCVQKLNGELEEREEEWGRSFRVLEQKYNSMQFQYEGQVKELQRDLNDAREKVTSHTHTRAQTSALEKELDTMRDKYDQKTAQLNEEISILRDALRASKVENAQTETKVSKTKRVRREPKVSSNARDEEPEIEGRLRGLSEDCARKDRVIEELRSTCAQLKRQREEMLQNKGYDESLKTTQKNLAERLDVVNLENRQLRDQLSEMSVEMDQQRVRYQGSLAEVERIARQEREASHDELRSLRTEHKKQVESIREEYAAEHSRSKMAEMSNKIAGLEIVIEKLKDKLARHAQTEADLASHKVHEEILKQEIAQLKHDVKKAKQFHTPEMQHYAQLEDKIVAMETRHSRREHELQSIIHKTRLTADVEKDEVLAKWRNLLRKKTEETERFRVELDGILSVLDDLRQQGVVIPMGKTQHIRN